MHHEYNSCFEHLRERHFVPPLSAVHNAAICRARGARSANGKVTRVGRREAVDSSPESNSSERYTGIQATYEDTCIKP